MSPHAAYAQQETDWQDAPTDDVLHPGGHSGGVVQSQQRQKVTKGECDARTGYVLADDRRTQQNSKTDVP